MPNLFKALPRKCSTIAFASALAASPALAGQLADGWLAYQRSDYAEALRIWGQLANQGLAGAQFDLGFMYANGRGLPQNYEQALFWYREAADQGYAYAQDEVGSMYAKGQGVPQNYEQAYIWFDLAASREGEATTPSKNRDDVAAKMTPAQIAAAQRMAREWKPK
jgi:uncharacterized protein